MSPKQPKIAQNSPKPPGGSGTGPEPNPGPAPGAAAPSLQVINGGGAINQVINGGVAINQVINGGGAINQLINGGGAINQVINGGVAINEVINGGGAINQEEEIPELEIDVDELLDMESDGARSARVQEILVDCYKPTETFVGDLLEKIRGMQKLNTPQKK
uniref:protein phosphatase 1 regulatory subunit 14B-like n=1 Tax=Lonchura striata TaxID=40157 RepID=UPI000B4CEBC2|nr:protein phosphatase 1 regulatory subunit 14B-like [Lonchura striata domestica]